MNKRADVCIDALATGATPDSADSLPVPIRGAVSARLVGFAAGGAPMVEVVVGSAFARFVAQSCVPLEVRDLWKHVVLLFDENDPDKPFVVGMLQPSGERTPEARSAPPPAQREIEIDGRTLLLSAQESITLQCGDASITLRSDGRIVIRGKHVVSHAAGVNRIRGGSVQLN